MKIFIIVSLLALSGCYTYPEKSVLVNVLVQERNDAQEVCSSVMNKRVVACTVVNDNPKRCTIIIDPYSANDNAELLGHEFLHCLEGKYHEEWKNSEPNKWYGPTR